jgi:hypothetical protein
VLIALQVWGNTHFAPEGPSVVLVDSRTGVPAEPVLVDRLTGEPISDAIHKIVPGPAAGRRVRKRLAVSMPAVPATRRPPGTSGKSKP